MTPVAWNIEDCINLQIAPIAESVPDLRAKYIPNRQLPSACRPIICARLRINPARQPSIIPILNENRRRNVIRHASQQALALQMSDFGTAILLMDANRPILIVA
jgi:hypothetical protein